MQISEEDIRSLLRETFFHNFLYLKNNRTHIGKYIEEQNNGILVQLADEKPILQRYYDGIVSKYKLHITSYEKGTYRLQHKEADKIYEYLYGISNYYQSTTTLLPSEYNYSYWTFLGYHTDLTKINNDNQNNIRFIIHSEERLIEDFLTYEDEWSKFLDKHKIDGKEMIKVLWIEKDLAEKLQYEKFDALKSIDLGVWFSDVEEYQHCAQWHLQRLQSGIVEGEFWLTVKKEDAAKIFENAQAFLNSLREHAQPIENLIEKARNEKGSIHDGNQFNFSSSIAENWESYLQPSERRRLLKEFISPVLEYYFGKDFRNRSLTMLDASSGIGCDAAELLQLCPNSKVFF